MELRPLTDILERLATYAEQYTPGFRQSLNPGWSRAALQEALDRAGFAWHPPEEWFVLYQWHNGYGGIGFGKKRASFIHYYEFMDVQEVLADRKRNDDAERYYADPDYVYYLPHLLSVFDCNAGFYAVECHDTPQAHGRVYHFFHERWLCYDSLHSMLAAKLHCYEAGIYALNDKGREDCLDEAACAEILLAYNPVRALTDLEMGESLAAYAHP